MIEAIAGAKFASPGYVATIVNGCVNGDGYPGKVTVASPAFKEAPGAAPPLRVKVTKPVGVPVAGAFAVTDTLIWNALGEEMGPLGVRLMVMFTGSEPATQGAIAEMMMKAAFIVPVIEKHFS